LLTFPSVRDVRGREHVVHGKESRQERIIVPVLHPAVATHNPPARRDLESDFQKLTRIIQDFR
jgi:uracil-DNA glycosylase